MKNKRESSPSNVSNEKTKKQKITTSLALNNSNGSSCIEKQKKKKTEVKILATLNDQKVASYQDINEDQD